MNYQTFVPHPDLAAFVKFYWTLDVPYDPANHKQKIIPDGCIEMSFNLADSIKRYTSETDYILNPSATVMGQRTYSYFIEPTGNVDAFSICFYPYGFANFINTPLSELVDREVPLKDLFGEVAAQTLEQSIIGAKDTQHRIDIIESFLLGRLKENSVIESIVNSTINTLLATKGSRSIKSIAADNLSQRRMLERKFTKQVGISPKQLSKVIRMQAALNLMLIDEKNLTAIAYESDYFDQAHFTKDFKELTGITPKEFLKDKTMELASLFYRS